MSKAYWNSECNHLLNEETKERWIKRVAPRAYRELSTPCKPSFEKYCEQMNYEYDTPYAELVDRTEHVKAMNMIVRNLNDESAYMEWITWVPDEAQEVDFVDIADDEELFDEVCRIFCNLIGRYRKHGFCFGSKAYGK